MAKTVADLLVERLIDWGVSTIFGLPGDGINGIMEGLRTHKEKIKFVQVRHEEVAAFAACGYAKYSGALGVCLATSGPGGIHLLNGLYDAKYDGQPVLAITGHTFHDRIGTHFQQDVDLDKVYMDVAAYNERIMGPYHVHNVLDEAIKTALARRTVAHVTIPKDIQEWDSSETERSSMNVPKHSSDVFVSAAPLPSEALLQRAAEVINGGSKPVILVGRGALQSRQEVLQLAEKVGAPIIWALLGKGVVPDDHPYNLGPIGLLGSGPSSEAMKDCDTFIMVGTSFPYVQFLPKPGQARCVQIDIDPARIGLRYPAEVGLVGDCRRVLEVLLPHLKRHEDRRFLEEAQQNLQHWNRIMEERAGRKDKPMKPQVIAHHLNQYLANDAIIASDCGTVTTWAARHIRLRDQMKFSCTGLLASMANGLPYAIGAAMAFPGRQVVAFVGDGGFTMLMGDFVTLVKYKLPVKVIVIKNNSLGQIRWEQMAMEGNPEFGCELQPIDFAAFARACGAPGYTVDDPERVDEVLRQAFAQPGPALVEAVVDPNEPPLPGNITTKQALKFAESMIRGEKDRFKIIETILKDKIREVV